MFKTKLSFHIFFPVILNGWKKYAAFLPKNWLAETQQTLASRRLGRQSAERERISEINWNFKKKKLQSNSLFLEFLYRQSPSV
jgi:hypothetical protein